MRCLSVRNCVLKKAMLSIVLCSVCTELSTYNFLKSIEQEETWVTESSLCYHRLPCPPFSKTLYLKSS